MRVLLQFTAQLLPTEATLLEEPNLQGKPGQATPQETQISFGGQRKSPEDHTEMLIMPCSCLHPRKVICLIRLPVGDFKLSHSLPFVLPLCATRVLFFNLF